MVTEECNRACEGCCNQQWDLSKLPKFKMEDLEGASEVLLTGGEPMLISSQLFYIIKALKRSTKAPIYVYTAETSRPEDVLGILQTCDGITVTLHEQTDVVPFLVLALLIHHDSTFTKGKSLRLNIFSGIVFDFSDFPGVENWVIKPNMIWEDPCPLPDGEVLLTWPTK